MYAVRAAQREGAGEKEEGLVTIEIHVTVVAETIGDAIRLIRDAAARVKEGRSGGEWQYCMGAMRFDLTDDMQDVERPNFHPCKRCHGTGRVMTGKGIVDCSCTPRASGPRAAEREGQERRRLARNGEGT